MNIDFKSFQITKKTINNDNLCISYAFIELLYDLNNDFSKKIEYNYYKYFANKKDMKEIDIQIKPVIIILFDKINVIIINNKIKKVNNIITLEKTYDNLFDFTNLNSKLLNAFNNDEYYLIIYRNYYIYNKCELDNYKFININDFKPLDKPVRVYNTIQDKINHPSFEILLIISFIELYIKKLTTPKTIFDSRLYYLLKSNELNSKMIPINYDLINLDKNINIVPITPNIPDKIDYVIFKDGNNIVYYKENITFNYYNKYMYLKHNNLYILKENFLELLSYFLKISVSKYTEYFISDNSDKEIYIYIHTTKYKLYIEQEIEKLNKIENFNLIYKPLIETHTFNNDETQQFMKINKTYFIDILKDYLHVLSEDTNNHQYYILSTTYKPLYELQKYTLINNIKKTIDKFKSNNNISLDEKYILSIYDYKLETEYYTKNITIDNIYYINYDKYIYIFEINNNNQTSEEETRRKIIKILYIIETPKNVYILGGRNKKFKVLYNEKNKKYYINYDNRKRYLSYKNTYKDNKNGKFYMKLKGLKIELYI